jgi:hypothetical protein
MMRRTPVLFCSVVLLLAVLAGPLAAREGGLPTPLRQLIGEDFLYSIDFLVFHRVAQGELRFSATDQPGVFSAELVGRTLGIASWLFGERTQTYTSLMTLAPDGSLLTVEHVAGIVKQRWGRRLSRVRRYRYDYRHGRIFDEKINEGTLRLLAEHDIPEGQRPVDMLTAFYNLRIGAYGHLERGSRFSIPTYSGGEFAGIEVRVLNREQQARHTMFPAHGVLVQVRIDPEIFETGSGNLFVWFDDAGVPGCGIIEDLVGFGDIRGHLDKEAL